MCTSISTCCNDRRSCLSNSIYNVDIKLILRVNLLIVWFKRTILSLLLIACIESIRVLEPCMLLSREVIVRVSNYTLIQTILRSTSCARSNRTFTCRSLWSRDCKTLRSLSQAILKLNVCFIGKVYVCWVDSIVNRTCNAFNVPFANYQSLRVCTCSTLIREYNVSFSSFNLCKCLTSKTSLVYIREHLSLNNLQLLILKNKTSDKVIEVKCKTIKIGINVLNIHVFQILNSVCIILYSTILKSLDSICIILYCTILKSLYCSLIISLKLSKFIIDDILDSSLVSLDKLLQFIILIAKSLVSFVVRFLKRLKSLIDGYDISTILFNILLCSLKILLSTLELFLKSLIGSLKILGCGIQVLNKLLDVLLVSFSKFLNLFSKNISLISLSLSSLQVTIFKVRNSLFNKSL